MLSQNLKMFINKYLQASDVELILYLRTFSTLGRSPTKLGEYWDGIYTSIIFKRNWGLRYS